MIRPLLRFFGVRFVARDEILKIARRVCDDKGWPWSEPIRVLERPFRTVVVTAGNRKGGNVIVVVDARNGNILSSILTTR
jgi:hypothetical protein